MYEDFYNLKAEPFRLSPDHNFCFEHKGYARAGAYMAYAYRRAEGFVMITGRPGTGKTTLIGDLIDSLSRDSVYVANLVCTQLQGDELLKSVAYSFDVGSVGIDKAELLRRLTVLFHRWHRENRRALLIVDEAQDLSPSAMEELRLLTNIQLNNEPLLQIFLVGQPELRDLVLRPEMEQVHQRIVAASHINSIEVEETEGYVMHRLHVVGWKGDPAIERGIFPVIHKFSEGVPRRINLICSRLFLLGSVEDRHTIDVADVAVVIGELQDEGLAAGSGFSPHDFQAPGVASWVLAPQTEAVDQVDPVAGAPLSGSDGLVLGHEATSTTQVATGGAGAAAAPVAEAFSTQTLPGHLSGDVSVSEVPEDTPSARSMPSVNAETDGAEAGAAEPVHSAPCHNAGKNAQTGGTLPSDQGEIQSEQRQGGGRDEIRPLQKLSSAGVIVIIILGLAYVAFDMSPAAFKARISGWLDVAQLQPGVAPADSGR